MKKIIFVLIILLGFNVLNAKEFVFTTSDSVNIYVNIEGKGTPCLFIHGGPGQGSYYWEKFAGEFCENQFMMVYIDQRGSGRSSSPVNSNYSLNRMIQDFEEVRNHLDIKEWMIMGHSFGGILQTAYANKYPSKISGILMFQCTLNISKSIEQSHIPTAIEMYGVHNSKYFLNTEAPIIERLDSLYNEIGNKGIDPWELSFSSKHEAMQFRNMFQELNEWNMDFSRKAFSISEYLQDYAPISENIKIPVLYFYGTNDINVGYGHYKSLGFPNLLLYPYDGKHMDFISNKQVYARAIEAFLDKFSID